MNHDIFHKLFVFVDLECLKDNEVFSSTTDLMRLTNTIKNEEIIKSEADPFDWRIYENRF